MKKAIGIAAVLILLCVGTSLKEPRFLGTDNIQNIINWTSLFSILAIGAAIVIIAGGIDLSIGSVVGLVGCTLSLLANRYQVPPGLAVLLVLLLAASIGLVHGLLVTKLRLQPFVVTLCGLLIYRGLARWSTGEATQGFGHERFDALREIVGAVSLPGFEDFKLPIPLFLMLGLALVAGGFLHWTIYGRYLLALGRNEQAARYSGINTDRMVILAYVLCSLIAGFGGVLLAFDINALQPSSFGDSWELYAIAGAVLGGCSLRGGEGSILGVVIGTALIRVLYNASSMLGISTSLEPTTIGVVILLGVMIDEIVHRVSARRQRRSG